MCIICMENDLVTADSILMCFFVICCCLYIRLISVFFILHFFLCCCCCLVGFTHKTCVHYLLPKDEIHLFPISKPYKTLLGVYFWIKIRHFWFLMTTHISPFFVCPSDENLNCGLFARIFPIDVCVCNEQKVTSGS